MQDFILVAPKLTGLIAEKVQLISKLCLLTPETHVEIKLITTMSAILIREDTKQMRQFSQVMAQIKAKGHGYQYWVAWSANNVFFYSF